MQIYVCIKHVPDSAANIAINDDNTIDERVAFLLNPYDEHGVTQAAAVKKQMPGSEIIAVCLGKTDAEKTIRSAMAMGADRGILVETDKVPDSITTARVLKAAIEQDGSPDLIFTGRESIDAEGMQTMFRLGVVCDMPVVNDAVGFEMIDESGDDCRRARVTVETGGGSTRVCELCLPCIVGAGRGLNTPSYPTFPDVVKARKKEIKTVALADLAVAPAQSASRIVELTPFAQHRSPKEISGSTAEVAARIVTILKEEAKVL